MKSGAGAAAVDAAGVAAQQRPAANGEAVPGVTLGDPRDPLRVELPAPHAEHVEGDAVVGEALERLLRVDARVEVQGDRVEHVVAQLVRERRASRNSAATSAPAKVKQQSVSDSIVSKA